MTSRNRWKVWVRVAHLALSLFGMLALMFFATTGFVMNHEDWFGLDDSREETTVGQVPSEMLVGPDTKAIVELLRSDYGAIGRMDDFEIDDDELTVEFRHPTGATEATIDTEGVLRVERRTYGALKVFTHLHQGKRTGTAGSWLIDLTAGVLLLAALSGIFLFVSIPKRRWLGVSAVAMGIVLFMMAYFIAVA